MTKLSIQELTNKYGLGLAVVSKGLRIPCEGWGEHHLYYVKLTARTIEGLCRCIYSGPYHVGTGHNGRRPKIEDVLSSVLSDCSAGESSFDDWCADCGYDTDSRKAYETWENCRKLALAFNAATAVRMRNDMRLALEDY